MASETGTATGMEDLLTRLIAFVTTDTGLTSQSPSQAWTVLRERRDNLANITSTYTASSSSAGQLRHLMRGEARSLNTDSNTSAFNYFSSLQNTPGDVTIELRQAREVTSFILAANDSANSAPRDFTLEYSDDGTNWTQCFSITDETDWIAFEERTYTFTSVGSHLYWRYNNLLANNGSRLYISKLNLLQTDGTIANHFGSEVIFRAPGLAGTDNIYTGIRTEYSESSGWYNFFLNGFQGYQSSASFFNQPGALNNEGQTYSYCVPAVPLWDDTMPYWFAASGRSLRFTIKVSTNYEAGYMGFINSYAATSQYPYPLIIGGSILLNATSNRESEWRYSNTDPEHSVFVGPASTSDPSSDFQDSSLYILDESGNWAYFGNRSISNPTSGTGINSMNRGTVHPAFTPTGAVRVTWPHNKNASQSSGYLPYRENLGGGYLLRDIVLLQRTPTTRNFGELEGIKDVPGFGNSPEDTTVSDGKNYTIFQNAFRSASWEFFAMELE